MADTEDRDSSKDDLEDQRSDLYRQSHGGYRELRSKIDEVKQIVAGILAAMAVLRWLLTTVGAAWIAITWSTCTRAIDNEAQIKVNTGRLTTLEALVNQLEINGSQTSKANASAIIELQKDNSDLTKKVDSYHEAASLKYDTWIRELSRLEETVDMHIREDKELEKDRSKQSPH